MSSEEQGLPEQLLASLAESLPLGEGIGRIPQSTSNASDLPPEESQGSLPFGSPEHLTPPLAAHKKHVGKRLVRKTEETPARRDWTPEQRLLILDSWRRSGLPAGDFAALFGVSKHTLYAWKKAFEAQGPAGLMDQPKGAKPGSRLPELTKRAILMLKETNPDWGCQRISDALLRGPALPASPGAVAKVLHEAGYELEEVATTPHLGASLPTGSDLSGEECQLIAELCSDLSRLAPEKYLQPAGGIEFSLDGAPLPEDVVMGIRLTLCDVNVANPDENLPHQLPRITRLERGWTRVRGRPGWALPPDVWWRFCSLDRGKQSVHETDADRHGPLAIGSDDSGQSYPTSPGTRSAG